MTRLVFLLILFLPASAKTLLVVTADASDYVLSAGGTIAAMIESGDRAIVVHVTNDDKESWNLGAEETAARTKIESEAAAKALGIATVVHMGYRAGELGGISPTEFRDRIMFYIRLHKPDVLFIPNPYAEYNEVFDRHYTGVAAEEARRIAALPNHQPPFQIVGMATHWTPELYYYAQPFDPRRREAEGPAAFVPQPVTRDITATFAKKVKAAQELKTINYATAMRIKQRLDESGRKLPLLEKVTGESAGKLVEINVRGLAEIAAKDTPYKLAEEFHYVGTDYQVPAKFKK